ncbi:toxin glutamine deamidase domain-containing protein [Streptomyces sp. NBC_01728]|uniref:toxin glutamine deamidase domain-containing protein n=1 Tax=unclassified Streptomyces TaxID=2593676 RepID=UPI002254EFFA|nr:MULTISPECIES: toxin glutamine deamidase domain-containing protein [unclassified Streptomyces]MCX4457250.1 toxin glutamine deamidase domain-containing protein [Streptomyces sp. NBC_01719]MCX4496607.1 toxin glutamine deamidase domain-containing protein [Streptomyces sp. NBC_01728]
MMLPDELEWVLEMLGYNWPTADEDKLRDSAALWRKFGDDVTALHEAANASARQVTAHNAGDSIDAFTKTYAKFDGGGGSDGYLANAAQAAHIIANVLEACAYLVEFAKWAVIAQLIALAIEIFAAQAAAPFTFGLSEVGALGATQATRLIVRRLLDELKEAILEAIVEAMKEPAVSAIEAIITDLIRQTVNVGFGAQQGYDLATTVKAGKDGAWDAIKQTPQTLAEGVRDSLGAKAGSRAHHAIDSRIDGYDGASGASGTSGADGGDGSGDGDGGSNSSDGDGGSDSSSRSSSDSNSNGSDSSGSDSSGSDSSASTRSGSGAGTNIGGGISADTGGSGVGGPDVGAGPGSDSGAGSDSGSGSGQNPSASDTSTSMPTPSLSGPTLSDFDDPTPSGTSPGAADSNGSSGPSHSGGGSSVSGLSSPSTQSAPSHASPAATSSSPGGGTIGTSIDSLAASAPTQTNASPTPTTSDPSPAGTGGRADGGSAIPTSPVAPPAAGGGASSHHGGSTSGSTPSGTSPTSPSPNSGAARTPSANTPGIPSPTGTGPASTPSPTSPTTTPRSTPSPTSDGRVPGTADGRTPGTPDGRIPTQRTPGSTTPGDGTTPRNTPGTTPGDRTPPRNTTPGDGTTPRNTPGNTTPGDRTAPRNTADPTGGTRTHTPGQNPSTTTPNQNPARSTPPRTASSSTSTPTTTPSTSTGTGSERTSTPSSRTPSSSTPSSGTPNSSNQPGPASSPTTQGTPGTGGTQNQPGTGSTPARPPQQPAGSTPNAPQQPAAQSNTPPNDPQQQQHQQVTAVPVHTVVRTPGSSTPASHHTPTTPQPPGSPQTDPGTPTDQQHPQQDSLQDIRDDLDHYPGGLTEPDPTDQQALADAVPHNEDGTPERFPDPFGSWSQLQNDGGNTVPGRSNNCADCSRSFLETWYGNPQVSAPRTPDTDEHGNPDPFAPENNANENQIRWTGAAHTYAGPGNNPETANNITSVLQQSGPGSAAIVQVDWPGGGGHAFNVVNHNGNIVWIDTQSGEVSNTPLHIDNAAHVWHIPLDADRNPIDTTQPDAQDTEHSEHSEHSEQGTDETSQQDTEAPQDGSDTPQEDTDNSQEGNEDQNSVATDPSGEDSDSAPGQDSADPNPRTTAGEPSVADADSSIEEGTPHVDSPQSDAASTGRSSDAAPASGPGPTHSDSQSEHGTTNDRDTPHPQDDVSASDNSLRTDGTNGLDPDTTTPGPGQNAPSPADRSDNADTRTATSNAVPSTPHTSPSDHSISGSPDRPNQGNTPPTGRHTTPGQTPSTPSSPDRRAPAEPAGTSQDPNGDTNGEDPHPKDDPARKNHPRLSEPESDTSTHYGMAPMEHQAELRRTNDVRQVDLDPVHHHLNDWLTPVPNEDGSGTRIPLVDALQTCSPPRPDDPDHKPTVLRHEDLARILPGFADMHPGERGAVVASLARLSLNFHASHAVGASPEPTDGYASHGANAHEKAGWNASHRDDQELKQAIEKEFGRSGIAGALRSSGDHHPDFTGRNYATVEVYDPVSKNISYVVDSSYPNPGGGEKGKHSERNILDYLTEVNQGRGEGEAYQALSMYSDREPCGHGQGYANCANLLTEEMRGVDVFYGTGYRKNAEVVDPTALPGGTYKKQFDKDLAANIAALGKIWVRTMSEGGLRDLEA